MEIELEDDKNMKLNFIESSFSWKKHGKQWNCKLWDLINFLRQGQNDFGFPYSDFGKS